MAVSSQNVKVDFYSESECPGCKGYCTSQVADAVKNVGSIMNLTFYPYGNAQENQSSTGEWVFTCQHGIVCFFPTSRYVKIIFVSLHVTPREICFHAKFLQTQVFAFQSHVACGCGNVSAFVLYTFMRAIHKPHIL